MSRCIQIQSKPQPQSQFEAITVTVIGPLLPGLNSSSSSSPSPLTLEYYVVASPTQQPMSKYARRIFLCSIESLPSLPPLLSVLSGIAYQRTSIPRAGPSESIKKFDPSNGPPILVLANLVVKKCFWVRFQAISCPKVSFSTSVFTLFSSQHPTVPDKSD